MSGQHLSKDFFELVKAIGESKSKQEEDRIIVREVAVLKKMMKETKVTAKRLKEFLVRIIYVEMLGHDASFGYIKAVELTACGNLLQKRVGYLCAGLCFSPDHEFRLMLVNRLQKDMISSNLLEVCAALMASCKIITKDYIPAVLPTIVELLKHEQDIVRKKAVMVLQRFNMIHAPSVAHLGDKFRRALCDKDPSVMGASLHVLYDLAKVDPTAFKDLVPSYVSILKQITEHRLPRDFDYHRIPAPWIQLQLLRILAILGTADQKASEQMYEVLLDVMRRADTGINVGYAIIYECVKTVTTIYPNSTLLDAAAGNIARFIKSDNHNLKYLGVTGLAAIVKDHPKYASEHQLAVIDCLEDPDETLQRKTLSLLYRMTNPVNVEVIVDKLITYLRGAVDVFLRMELVARITEAAERFAPNNNWYISTMTEVFELGAELTRPENAQNVVSLISEGAGEDDEEADTEMRRHAVEIYLKLLDKPALPDVLMQVLCWVLGEYGYLSTSLELEAISNKVCALATRPNVEPTTRGYAITAALKLTAQLGRLTPQAAAVVEKYSASRHADLAQRCLEFRALLARPATMGNVLPVDASCEEIEVDEELGFLDAYVADQRSRGAKEYAPPAESEDGEGAAGAAGGDDADGGLRFEAYENPEEATATSTVDLGAVSGGAGGAGDVGAAGGGGGAGGLGGLGGAAGGLGGLGGIKSVWGETGYAGGATSAGVGGGGGGDGGGGEGGSGGGGAGGASRGGGGSAHRPWDISGATGGAKPADRSASPPASGTNGAAASGSGGAGGGSGGGGSGGRASFREPVEPVKPRELTEKEKMAAALFGGVSSSSPVAKPGGGGGGGGVRGRGAASKPAPSGGGGGGGDMFGGLSTAGGAAPAAAKPAAAKPAAAADDDDLLGLDFGGGRGGGGGGGGGDLFGGGGGGGGGDLFGGGAAAAPAAAAPAAAGGGGGGGDDLFGGLSSGGGAAPAGAAGAPAGGADALSSAFADMGLDSVGGGGGGGGGAAPDFASLPVPAPLAAAAAGTKSSDGNVLLANDGNVWVAGHKVWQDGAIALVLFVASNGSAPLSDISVRFEPASFLRPSYRGAPMPRETAANTLALGALPPGKAGSVCVLTSFTLCAAPFNGAAVRGEVSYSALGKTVSKLSFSVPFDTSDTLRPATITTQQFGGAWGSHVHERKQSFASKAVNSPAAFMSAVKGALHAHPVEAIAATSEAIAAARLMGTQQLVLLHGKVHPTGMVDVTVRSQDAGFSGHIAMLAQAAMR